MDRRRAASLTVQGQGPGPGEERGAEKGNTKKLGADRREVDRAIGTKRATEADRARERSWTGS